MNEYKVIYNTTFTPNDWYEGNQLISEVKFGKVEADSKEEAKQKFQEEISKMDFEDEKGCTENRIADVEIIK